MHGPPSHKLFLFLLSRQEMASSHLLLAAFSFILLLLAVDKAVSVDPTEGFTALPLKNFNFVIQRPYDVPENQRYSFIDGVHKLWVYKTDKPQTPTSHSNPRTEIRISVSKTINK